MKEEKPENYIRWNRFKDKVPENDIYILYSDGSLIGYGLYDAINQHIRRQHDTINAKFWTTVSLPAQFIDEEN